LTKRTKIAIIENATSNKQKVIIGNLDNIDTKVKQKKVQSPSMIIIGNVVGIQNKIEWFSPNPYVLKKSIS
jgi:siroheme synthase